MSVNAVNNNSYAYTNAADTTNQAAKKSETDNKQAATSADKAAVYEKSSTTKTDTSKQIYSMSKADRAAIVQQMKTDMANRQSQLASIVSKMISNQGSTYGKASGDDMWKFLAGGNFTVDPATKAQAQADIADDGYWGVEQTSQRIFDFAQALAGDDEEMMKKMEAAVEKGFKQATQAWGKKLPDITSKTHDAIKEKFNAYYNSKKTAE